MQEIYTVSEFNTKVDNLLQNNFKNISIEGEVSECKVSSSGAVYFSLCDKESSVSCVCFRFSYPLDFELKEGIKVIICGSASLYKKRGSYQIIISSIRLAGKGNILERIAQNNEKWKTTYFAREKRPIPKGIKNLFVVTSPQGAVVHDIIRTRNIRNRSANIFVFPAIMQGETSHLSVSNQVYYANFIMDKLVNNPELNKQGFSYDNTLLIVARGGGNFDDLLPFYDEEIVKSFSLSKLILISAIGHEVNTPSCNFASDRYVSTPTQAVEVALFDKESEKKHFSQLKKSLESRMQNTLFTSIQHFDNLKSVLDLSLANISQRAEKELLSMKSNLILSFNEKFSFERDRFNNSKRNFDNLLSTFIESREKKLCDMMTKLSISANHIYEKGKLHAAHIFETLSNISPKNVMKRGYSVISSSSSTITKASELKKGEYNIVFYDGSVDAQITPVPVK